MSTARDALAQWMEYLAHERRSSPRTLEAYGFAANRYMSPAAEIGVEPVPPELIVSEKPPGPVIEIVDEPVKLLVEQ